MFTHAKVWVLALYVSAVHAWGEPSRAAGDRPRLIVVTNGRPKGVANWAQEPPPTPEQDKFRSGFGPEPQLWPPMPERTPLTPLNKVSGLV